ncbi:Reverse transcriptase (RNA-dependent DNA polymerase) [Fragilaria crotonensis]|nr:Reverse transcriptase (RNA-dependent DNA polymerase) [Fragilaria crotonensis]
MADRNSKRSPAATRVLMGLARTKKLKAVKFWVNKKLREDAPCDLTELNDAKIAQLIREMSLVKEGKESDSKLYYPDAFNASDYKNWIKKVTNYLDSRKGKAGVPLSYVIRPADADPNDAPDEYTRTLWAVSFDTPQYIEDNREVYHLFKDLLTKTDGATWFEKVSDGDGRAAHLLLREHYIGEAHDMRRAASANAKLEALFWKSEAAFPFEKYLTRMNEAFKELEDAGQPMYEQQRYSSFFAAYVVTIFRFRRLWEFDEWEKLRTCGGIAYIHQRREYLANRGGSGRFDGRGGGYGRGGGRGYADRGSYGGRGGGRYTNDNRTSDQPRAIAATAANSSTEVVEYDADARMRRPVLRLLEVIVVEKRVLDSGPDTGSRTRSINAVNRGDEFRTEEGYNARCEMDSHADTCVAGPNFKILEYTGEQCDVSPYTSDYDPITNVSVVNAATAFTDESSGETVILRFNQVLWYGSRMRMSLINPNQLRYYGVSVSDDPTDSTRPFGITIANVVHVPFKMDGTTVYFETRVPTQYELENCKTIQMTDDTVWEPSSVSIANVSVMSSDLPIIEMSERRKISAMRIRNNDNVLPPDESSNDLMPYDDATFLNRMISNVRVATSYREASISFIGSKDRHSRVNAETVARRFRCGIETAQKTLKTTTQRGVRYAIHPLHRRYRVDHLNLHRRRLADTFYMDTLFSKVKSLNGMECAQLITNGSFTRVYPMASKSSHDIAQALTEFIDDVGVPGTLICDFATEQTGKNTEVMKVVRRNQIRLLLAEKGRGTTQNHRAETEIREIKTKWKTRMRENQVPSRLWDYGLVYISEIQSLLARGPDQRPGIEKILGQTVDISEWLDFDFYDRVWYWDHHKTDMNNEQARIGRWLGIAHRVGSDMTYWILTRAGHVIARSTVQHITVTDMAIDAIRDQVSAFDNDLAIRMNDENFQLDHPNPVFYLQDDVPLRLTPLTMIFRPMQNTGT